MLAFDPGCRPKPEWHSSGYRWKSENEALILPVLIMALFNTTQWSVVRAAGRGNPEALSDICQSYRPAILAWLRASGVPDHDVDDIAQSFLLALLDGRLCRQADAQAGRFRNYLLSSLKHFQINQHRRDQTAKRGGGATHVPMDGSLNISGASSPEQAFHDAFALRLVRLALDNLEAEARQNGKSELFQALVPLLLEQPERSEYRRLAERFAMRSNTVAVAVHRLKQRLRELIREEVARTVSDEASFEQEMGFLSDRFSRSV